MRHVWKVYCVHGFMELSDIRVFLGLDKNLGIAPGMVQNALGEDLLSRERSGLGCRVDSFSHRPRAPRVFARYSLH